MDLVRLFSLEVVVIFVGDQSCQLIQQRPGPTEFSIAKMPEDITLARYQYHPKKQSLAEKYFFSLPSYEIWHLMQTKTQYGSTFLHCIRSALENTDAKVGLYATDAECYDLFSCLFLPVIMDYHKIDLQNFTFTHDFGDPSAIEDLPQNLASMIKSTRARVGRTVQGYPMAPMMTLQQRLELEDCIRSALQNLDGDLAGEYKSLVDMSLEEQQHLRDKHILFQTNTDRHLQSAGSYAHWPKGRGIYISKDESFIVWVNEEDHIRIISLSNNANMREVYGRLVRAVNVLSDKLGFTQHERLGYLTHCPTNIGTAIRASVHAQLPRLEASGKLREICSNFGVQVRGIGGEHTESEASIYDLSNASRLGKTEFQVIHEMWNGIQQILKQEANERI